MRTAILGLCVSQEDLPAVASDVSRVTHHDPRSVAGGVGVASLLGSLVTTPHDRPEAHLNRMSLAMKPIHSDFSALISGLSDFVGASPEEAAPHFACPDQHAPRLQSPIITPYVLSTVLACTWSVLSFPGSWQQAVEAVIRLGGDVDTTGAIVGTIMGAKLGIDAIPKTLAEHVQDRQRILLLSRRLFLMWKGNLTRNNS